MNAKPSDKKTLTITISVISLILWLISLTMTGFVSGNPSFLKLHVSSGWEILIFGTILGFMDPKTWTVYANLFYFISLFMLWSLGKPKKSVYIMVGLSAFFSFSVFGTLFIPSVGGYKSIVISWGWGAFIWLYSLFLIAIAALLSHQKIHNKKAYCMMIIGLIPLLAIAILGISQRQNSNAFEKEKYFSQPDVAFTKFPILGYPYQPLTEKLPKNSTVELIFDGNIPDEIKLLHHSLPKAYWLNDIFWRSYHTRIMSDISIRQQTSSPANYQLNISEIQSNDYLFALKKMADESIIYQQVFRTDFSNTSGDGFSPSIKYHLPDEISDLGRSEVRQLLWQSEKGSEKCLIQQTEVQPSKTAIQFDKRVVRFTGTKPFIPTFGLCSDNYLLAIIPRIRSAILFERKTGIPIAEFKNRKKNKLKLSKSQINSFELHINEDDKKTYILLPNSEGDTRLTLVERQEKI